MYKIRKILSIFTVLIFFLLFSISPVLAEEAAGSIDGGSEAAEETDALDDSTGTVEETTEAVEDSAGANEAAQPIDDNPVLNVIVPIEDNVEAAESDGTERETTDSIDDSAGANETTPPEEDNPVLDVIVPIGGGIEDIEEDQLAAESPVYTVTDDVLNVIVPIQVDITIDPLELAGKGQIYSDVYNIKNDGDTDVLLTFTDIQVTFADDTNFEPLAQPFERISSNLKSIYMLLDFGRDDIPPAIITDLSTKSAISIPLSSTQNDAAENSLLQLNFSGSVNEAPALSWQDNDVKISMNYTLEAVPPPVEVTAPLTTEAAIEVPVDEEATPPVDEEATPPVDEEATPPVDEEATPPVDEEATPPAETHPESSAEPYESVDTTESPPESDSPESSAPSESPEPSDMNQETQDSPSEPSI